jgi:hypothetical protein
MTKRLTRFMNNIEHYDPMFIWRPGWLQVVSDTLSRIPGVREKGEPADTLRFLEIDDHEDNAETTSSTPASYS